MTRLPPIAWRPLAAVTAAVFVLLMATASSYGFHRDELYFIEAGHHPAWGYDDQPPLTPLIARAATGVFGATPAGLRVPSALAYAVCVLLAALTARELGGGRRAQLAAALSLAASAAIFVGHLVSTTTYDFLAWTLLLYLVVRIVRRDQPRLWPAFGLVAGLALENKWLVMSLLVALGAGAVLAKDAGFLRNRWLLLGGLVALALWLPNLVWQANHGWPQRELAGQIADEDPLGTRIKFLPYQLVMISPVLAYLWLAGLRRLLREPAAGGLRLIALGYLTLVAICLVTGAKEYYALGFYPALLAAGAVALEDKLARRRHRRRLAAALVLSAVVAWPIQLPLIPQGSLRDDPFAGVNADALETVGWPRFVDAVAGVWRRLPPAQRRRAVIFTANYGEAGAIELYGPGRGLPRAYSGHNSFASFGTPAGSAAPVIVIGFDERAYVDRFFAGCRTVTHFDNRLEVDNQEQGAPIDVCAGPRRPWAELWPRLKHLDA